MSPSVSRPISAQTPVGTLSRRRLTQPHIAEANVGERLQVPGDGRYRSEELEPLHDRHVEDFGDGW